MADFDRHLRFPGTINFRDMGGYETSDARRIKTGRLFRSGHLAHSEETAQQDVAALNISLVCDFRIDDERAAHPSQYQSDHEPTVKHLPVWPVGTPGVDNTAARMLSGDADFETALADQTNAYREFIRDQSSQFAGMFEAMLAIEHDAVLLHCSAGKDRTGIAAALLLSALGLPRDTVRHDYLLSLEGHGAREQTQFYVDRYWTAHIENHGTDPVCSQGDMHRLFSVQPEKIDAAFDEMESVAGSVEGYLRVTLGLDDDALTALRQRYVEPR